MDLVPVADGILSILYHDTYCVVGHHIFRQYRITTPYLLYKKTESLGEKLREINKLPAERRELSYLHLREVGLYTRNESNFNIQSITHVHTLNELRSLRDSNVAIRFLTYKDNVLVILDEMTHHTAVYYKNLGTDQPKKIRKKIRSQKDRYIGQPSTISNLPRIEEEHKYIKKTKKGVYTFVTKKHPQFQKVNPDLTKKLVHGLTEEDRSRYRDQSLQELIHTEGLPFARVGSRTYHIPNGKTLVLYASAEVRRDFYNHLLSQDKQTVILTRTPVIELPILEPDEVGIDFLGLILDNFPEEYLPLLKAIEQIYELRNFAADFQSFLISYMESMSPEDRRTFSVNKLYRHLKFSKPEELQTSMTPSKKLNIVRFFEVFGHLGFLEKKTESYFPNIIQISIGDTRTALITTLLLQKYLATIASDIELLIVDDDQLSTLLYRSEIFAATDPILSMMTKIVSSNYPQRQGFEVAYKIVDAPNDLILETIYKHNTDRPYLVNEQTYLVMPNNNLHKVTLLKAAEYKAELIRPPEEIDTEEEKPDTEKSEKTKQPKTNGKEVREQQQSEQGLDPKLVELKKKREERERKKKEDQARAKQKKQVKEEKRAREEKKEKEKQEDLTAEVQHTTRDEPEPIENEEKDTEVESDNKEQLKVNKHEAVEGDETEVVDTEQTVNEQEPAIKTSVLDVRVDNPYVQKFNRVFKIPQLVEKNATAEKLVDVEKIVMVIKNGIPLMQLVSKLYYSHTKRINRDELDIDDEPLEYAQQRELILIDPDNTILLLPNGSQLMEDLIIAMKDMGKEYDKELLIHIDEILEYQREYGDLTHAYSVLFYPVVVALGYYSYFRRLPPFLLAVVNLMTKLKNYRIKNPSEFGNVYHASIIEYMSIYTKDIEKELATQLEPIGERGDVPLPLEKTKAVDTEDDGKEVELDLVPEPIIERDEEAIDKRNSKAIPSDGGQHLDLDKIRDGPPIVRKPSKKKKKKTNKVVIQPRKIEKITREEFDDLIEQQEELNWKDDTRLLRHVSRVVAGDYEVPAILRKSATSKIDELWSFSIHQLKLSTRICNVLYDHGITSVQDLVFNTITSDLKGIGKKSLEEILRYQQILGNPEYLRDEDLAYLLSDFGIAEYVIRGGYIPRHMLPSNIYFSPELRRIGDKENEPIELVERFLVDIAQHIGVSERKRGGSRSHVSTLLAKVMSYQRQHHRFLYDSDQKELVELKLGHVFKYQDRYLCGDEEVKELLVEELRGYAEQLVISPVVFTSE